MSFFSFMRIWPLFFVLLLIQSGCSSLLYHPNNFVYVDREKMPVQPEDHWIEVEESVKLHAWSMRPKGNLRAVVLQFHGNAENLTSHLRSLYWLTEKGYALFSFDYRSYGKSSGQPSPKNTVRDGIKVIEYVRRQYPDQTLIVYGQSLGGAIAMRSAAELKNRHEIIDLMIIEGSFHSYRAVSRRALGKSALTWVLQPLAWLVMSDRYAPEGHIHKISPIPMLVIHGEGDPIIPIDLGREIFKEAGEPKFFKPIPEGRHIDTFFREEKRYRPQFLEWLDEALKSRQS